MEQHDIYTADYYDSYGSNWNYVDTVSPFYVVSSRKTNTEIYSISRKGTACSGIWIACYLLFERCKHLQRQSRSAGTGRDCAGYCTALLEKTNAFVNRWWNHMLYVVSAVYLLMNKSLYFCAFLTAGVIL